MRKVEGERSMWRQLIMIHCHDRWALWPSLGHFLPSPGYSVDRELQRQLSCLKLGFLLEKGRIY